MPRPVPAAITAPFVSGPERCLPGLSVQTSAGPSVANGSALSLPLKNLKPGRYRVSWHAVSIDTHRSEGKYNFLVAPK